MVESVLNYRVEYHLQHDGTMRCTAHIESPAITAEGQTLPEVLHNLRTAVEFYYTANGVTEIPQLAEYCVATVA